MRSLLKRKSEPAGVLIAPSWHPNFRNFERLPDTKVVRTAFFVNGIAIMVAVVMALWFSYQTYQLHSIHRQIADVQRQIDRDQPGSTQAIALYHKFQAEAKRVGEVDTFVKSKPLVSELLLRLAETLPANIALDGFDFHDSVVTLRATVRGAPDQASGYASAYLDQLKADANLAAKFEDISVVDLSRSPQTGRLIMEMSLKLKGAAKGGKK